MPSAYYNVHVDNQWEYSQTRVITRTGECNLPIRISNNDDDDDDDGATDDENSESHVCMICMI